ncbi:unnamed protein product [Strongylus vulgaris]|uniref:ADAMTS cysteine-rich domain-containing protein n=1 Tax=Strongylus vulgaris TaxID=40348 RepID=A0A3P7L210_STRVU|nr:unnamed protein product [Strongylus vulgaris]
MHSPIERAEWGIWGTWSSCSASCGGGLSTRVRGCYGGNRLCPGSSLQTQHCNTQECPTRRAMCTGRIKLPCDLADYISFGQDPERNAGEDFLILYLNHNMSLNTKSIFY